MTRKDTLIWHGYHDLRELPIKRGARVYIPKGTHPQGQESFPLGKPDADTEWSCIMFSLGER